MRGVEPVLAHHPDVRGTRGASSASLFYRRAMELVVTGTIMWRHLLLAQGLCVEALCDLIKR